MKRKLTNFDLVISNLIFRNLLTNYLNLTKEQIQKQQLTEQMFFEIGALENYAIFGGKHLCWSVFLIKLKVFNFPVNITKFLSFFHKTLPMAPSEKSINFRGKHKWRRRSRFIFLLNTT